MKKEERINQAYNKKKEEHGNVTIILFHVGDYFEAYYSDADVLAQLTQLKQYTVSGTIPFVRFPADEIELYMNKLADANQSVCISEIRGASGRPILESL